jgi:hypothetical protein
MFLAEEGRTWSEEAGANPPYGPTQQTAAPNSAHTAHPQARDRGQHGHGSGMSAVRHATGAAK